MTGLDKRRVGQEQEGLQHTFQNLHPFFPFAFSTTKNTFMPCTWWPFQSCSYNWQLKTQTNTRYLLQYVFCPWIISTETCKCSSLSHPTVQLPWVSSEWQQLVSGDYPSAGCLHVPSASTCWLRRCGSRGQDACTAYWSAPTEWVVHEHAVGMPAKQIKELSSLADKRRDADDTIQQERWWCPPP